MGKIHKILATCKLPKRDEHNSRMFVDMNENVHFHYREHRMIFSVEEFRQFSNAIIEAWPEMEKQVLNGYKESEDLKDTPANIIGGSQTEFMDLPNPKESAYFDDRLQIEKQVDGYGDVIHFHYRDHRIVMRKYETWKRFCECVAEAWKNTKQEFFKE